MSYFSEPEKKPFSLKIGLFVMALIAIGATYASNISINGSNRIEFGQGVYAIEACNGWVQIQIPTVSVDETGTSPITGFIIDGVDPRQCASTLMHFKAFSSSSTDPLPLYSTTDPVDLVTSVSQVSLNISENGFIQLVDDDGTPIESSCTDIPTPPICMNFDSQTQRITVYFSKFPLTHWGDLNSLTVESGPNSVSPSA